MVETTEAGAFSAEDLPKTPSGVSGLDEITDGGLPQGRPTLVCGTAGCGKTLLGMQFLVRGILDHDESGVFMSFEETDQEIAQNVRSLGWDLAALEEQGKLSMDAVRIRPSEIHETGAYDLEGIFIRLGAAIAEVSATRVVLDTIEVLFSALEDESRIRSELRRLFDWLKEQGVTAIVTAERGEGSLTRHGLEEYVSDCVILLDHRISDQLSTRRLRVVKYRGSAHSSDECPFLIDDHGIQAIPLTSIRLEHDATWDRVSTGVERLDTMLDGQGYFRGSSILVSGTPGVGKTTLGASFVDAACARAERALVFAFEESPQQLLRNMSSVGIDLRPHLDGGLLRIVSTRPSAHGFEAHLAAIITDVQAFDPHVVVIDPLSAFDDRGVERDSLFARLVDLFKVRGITALSTSLVASTSELAGLGVSSVVDTWIELTAIASDGEVNRALRIIKSRGMPHSNQLREFRLTGDGVELRDVYTGPSGVLMGSARQAQEVDDRVAHRLREQRIESNQRRLERRRAEIEFQIDALRARLQDEVEALEFDIAADRTIGAERLQSIADSALTRGADSDLGEPR